MQFDQTERISDFLQTWLEESLLEPNDDSVLKEYYRNYVRNFPPRMKYFYDRQTEEVMSLISSHGSPRVLEIGCGCGTESLWMSMHGGVVDGIDVNQSRLRVADERRKVLEENLGRELPCRFLHKSVMDIELNAKEIGAAYDVIWMEQAFHHLEPRRDVVARCAELLKPGGYLVISESNALNPLIQLALFRTRGLTTVKKYTDDSGKTHLYGNERVLSARSLSRQFATHGVERKTLSYFRIFPSHPRFDAWQNVEHAIPKAIRPVFTHYNYVGQKLAS